MNEEQNQQEFVRQLAIYSAIYLQTRAQGMVNHAKTHEDVSETIVTCVIGGQQYIGMIWHARTLGTHGEAAADIVAARYNIAGKEVPKDPGGKLPRVLTTEELENAVKAAREFEVWLQVNKPVIVNAAIQAFQDIGRKYRSTDTNFEFIMTLSDARHILQFIAEGAK